MANANETGLRGEQSPGSEERPIDAADLKSKNLDSKLRLDGESDALYDDGLEVDDDSETLADTHAERGTGAAPKI